MAIGTGALGQYAIGQSQTQSLAIAPSLLTNTSVFYSPDIGRQYIYAPLLTNTNTFYQRVGIWTARAKQSETWIERTKQSETWARVA